ncbi:uncharacterized protein [Primulina huaijiensis]|uniref:uncharacterized protein n=1 Tax=Primulina huaijiensis TaxID=1492673 RepID=UPI003CC781B2
MSWLARSIANTLHLENEDDPALPPRPSDEGSPEDRSGDGATLLEEDQRSADSDDDRSYDSYHGDDGDRDGEDDNNQGRGVREDLSELKDTFTRQFWGVASFLAPPPPPPPPPPRPVQKSVLMRPDSKSNWGESDNDYDDEEEELVEYDQRHSCQFREISNLSRSEDFSCTMTTIDDAIGITEEVLAFARNIAHHPETWLDFPLSEEEEFDDFDISDAQYKHALAVEQEAPRLAALRIELSPVHMSEGYFWTVYFVLLHSRLNKHDADLLSSPQIAQARSMWMKELHEKTKDKSQLIGSTSQLKENSDYTQKFNSYEDTHSRYASGRMSPFDPSTPHERGDNETEKQLFCEVEYIEKSVVNEDPPLKPLEMKMVVGQCFEKPALDDDYDDDDDWLKEDPDLDVYSGSKIIGNEEDVSFSDLEDDTDYNTPLKSKTFVTESRTATNTS